MKVAKELGLKWNPNVDVPVFAVSNNKEMAKWRSGVLLWFEVFVVWMRQVLQLFLIGCGRAERSLPAATQPLIQTQGRQIKMNAFPWLFKAKSRRACLKGKKKSHRERSGRVMSACCI